MHSGHSRGSDGRRGTSGRLQRLEPGAGIADGNIEWKQRRQNRRGAVLGTGDGEVARAVLVTRATEIGAAGGGLVHQAASRGVGQRSGRSS